MDIAVYDEVENFVEFSSEVGAVRMLHDEWLENTVEFTKINVSGTPDEVAKFFKALAKTIKKNYCKE
jgi:hypothetical protein